jgi:Protein of unknown function (DUF992).
MKLKVFLAGAVLAGISTVALAADMPRYKYYQPAPVAAPGVKVGVLTCHIDGGWGMLIVSNKAMECEFRGAGRRERYTGTITKVGVDIGVTSASSITWSVIAPSRNINSHDLAGGYGGVTAEATFVAGVGANVLLGGGNGSIALQPISVQSQSGLNIAAGIGGIALHPVYNASRTSYNW